MNNPYFQPGPDGRRPIVERVPECRPDGLFLDTHVGVNGREWHLMLANNPASIETTEAAALALCRCSVADWLIRTGEHLQIEDESGKRVWVTTDDDAVGASAFESMMPGERSAGDYQQAVHLAINATAHARADLLNIRR